MKILILLSFILINEIRALNVYPTYDLLDNPIQNQEVPTWEYCRNDVCNQVEEQAHSLGKLKLMKSYIERTMNMLNMLVKSIDQELITSGQNLAKFVGDSCPKTDILIKEITNYEIGVSDNFEEYVDYGQTTENYNIDDAGSAGSGSGSQSTEYVPPSNLGDKDIQQPYKGGKTPVEFPQQVDQNQQHNTNNNRNPTNQGSDGKDINRPQGNTKNTNQNPVNDLHGSSSSNSQITKDPHDDMRCQGVPKGSAHWVPGLDQWCTQNCDAGYCPPTHCICSTS